MVPTRSGTRSDQVATSRLACWMLLSAAVWVAGCASPGQPKPPSLQLPQVIKDLSATRVGPEVHLHWTTPALTTDNLPVPAQMSAIVCRQIAPASSADRGRCTAVAKMAVHPGPSETEDVLPPGLVSGAPGLLAYRVEIFNPAGRSAGRSAEAWAASGAAPPVVEGLTATPIRNGVRLRWDGLGDVVAGRASVELERVETSAATAAQRTRRRSPELAGTGKPRAEVHLSVGEAGGPDAGGAIDRSAQKGATYRYVAQRVRSEVVGGHTVLVRSLPSAAAMVSVLDTFAPQPPAGLETAAGGGERPSIGLSWRPGVEADLAGYNVYRKDGGEGAWRRLNAALLPVPGYTDTAVLAGTRYVYRVTAVDSNGNESAPGPEVQDTTGNR